MCLAQGHNAVTPVRLEPANPPSQVKYSTTRPLRYPKRRCRKTDRQKDMLTYKLSIWALRASTNLSWRVLKMDKSISDHGCSQNAAIATHIEGRQLKGATDFIICVDFSYRKEFAPARSEFFPLRAVLYGWKRLVSTLGFWFGLVLYVPVKRSCRDGWFT